MVVAARIEVRELIDAVEHIAHQLLEEKAGRDSDFTAKTAGYGGSERAEPRGCDPIADGNELSGVREKASDLRRGGREKLRWVVPLEAAR